MPGVHELEQTSFGIASRNSRVTHGKLNVQEAQQHNAVLSLQCHDNEKQAEDDFQQVIKEKIREVNREREVRKDLETQLVLTQQTKTQFTILVENVCTSFGQSLI